MKTINISRCQQYKLDRFSFEFIAKIQLTWDAVVVHTRLSLLLFLLLLLLSLMSLRDMCIKLNIFYEYLAKLLVPNVTSRINYFTPCPILANLPAVSLKHDSQGFVFLIRKFIVHFYEETCGSLISNRLILYIDNNLLC